MSTRVQSIERGIDILMALANGARTLTDVAKATGLSKGTTFRLLASLSHEQLVIRDPEDTVYVLGPGFLRMFQGAMTNLGGIATLANSALQEVRERTGETVAIHVRIGYERICVAEQQSLNPLRYTASVGATAPIYVGSAGKMLMALMQPRELEKTLNDLQLRPLTHMTITDRQRLRDEVALAARQGWATSDGERITGAAAITVPIHDHSRLSAVLSVLGPADRLTSSARLAMLPDLQRAAAAIELSMSDRGGDTRATESAVAR
jgi:DNA-binding IclR family transcriptional regulator